MAYTPYVPTDWKNLPDQTTPISEAALDHIEQGIANLDENCIHYEEIGTIDDTTGEVTLNSQN